ncbi:hypothetical protein PG301_13220 [Parageobacillus sp. G301]|nr:hypothetical protein PG301_13220 [Parageobacillus sp. G301]
MGFTIIFFIYFPFDYEEGLLHLLQKDRPAAYLFSVQYLVGADFCFKLSKR